MSFQTGSLFEAVPEKFRQQSFVFAEGDDAVANVIRRKHIEFLAQASAGSTIVADRDHGGEISNYGRIWRPAASVRSREDIALQAFQKGGQARSAANGNHSQASCLRGLLCCHELGDFAFHQSSSADRAGLE